MMHHIQTLAVEIGPRGSCTPAERKAAEYVAERLRFYGAEVRVEPFKSFSSFAWPWATIYLLGALGGLLAWFNMWLAFLISLLGAVLFYDQGRGRLELGDVLPFRTHPSQNVIGVIRPTGEVRRRLVISGHLDTNRASELFKPGLVERFRFNYLSTAVAAFSLPVLAQVGRLVLPVWPWWPWVMLVPTAVLFFSFLMLIHRELFHKYTHGANDNASGIASMLGVAEVLGRKPLEQTEVWCVATGCEEVGMIGMRRFLAAHKEELADADFIVLDNHGKGQVKYTLGEGMLGVVACDRGLVELAARLAAEHPEWNLGTSYNKLMPTDMGPVLREGLRAIHIRAEDEAGLLPNWHWYSDTIENVDPENLQIVRDLVLAMAWELDRQAAPARDGGDQSC